jgi:DNA primase
VSVTDEIKSRIDIVSYINQYVPLKRSGRYHKACCPFHSEKTPSFVVNDDSQSWRCFGACAEGGDLFSFVMKYHSWDFKEALQELGKQAGVEVQKQTPQQRQKTEEADRVRGVLETAAKIYHDHLLSDKNDDVRQVLAYTMQKRGFTLETIKTFQIGYAPDGWQNTLEALTQIGYDEDLILAAGLVRKSDTGRVYDYFRNRLMLPIRDARGRVIGFGARVLDPEDNPKYLNSPQTLVFDKSKVLFGFDAAKHSIRESETAVIVEGYMDVIQAHQGGFTNVVAQMGTAMTETQLNLLVPRYAKKIVLALDADAAGQNATRRSLETARQTLTADYAGRLSADIRILQIPGAKDPDDLIRETPEQWAALVENATPVADYVIAQEMATLPQNATVQEREAVARRLLPMLTASESDLYKQSNIQMLALHLRLPEQTLLQWADAQMEAQRRSQDAQDQRRKQSPPPSRLEDDVELPPPPDPALLDMYDDDDDDAAYEPVAPSSPANVTEKYCLRMLLQNPDTYYMINRKFRELSAGEVTLLKGPLCNLNTEDFTRSGYQALLRLFMEALGQSDQDVMAYLQARLDDELQRTFDDLRETDDDHMRDRVNQRFGGDFAQLMRQYDRRIRPTIDQQRELIGAALKLRLRRLNQEIHEHRFMQQELHEDDGQMAQHISQRVETSRWARNLLDAELALYNDFR